MRVGVIVVRRGGLTVVDRCGASIVDSSNDTRCHTALILTFDIVPFGIVVLIFFVSGHVAEYFSLGMRFYCRQILA